MTGEEVIEHLARRLPNVVPTEAPEALTGGLLNQTWRVRAAMGSWVVKHAPPFIATVPDVPLDPARLAFEARALADLAPKGRLAGTAGSAVRAPLLVDFDPLAHVLVMEDLGPAEDLGFHLRRANEMGELARGLGHFIGRLHTWTLDRLDLVADYRNLPVQETRYRLQYATVGSLLATAGVPDAEGLGRIARELGERLQGPGRCVVMGDLWPPSLLITPSGLRLIDWEFAHFGSPAQDLGHLAAHLWMLHHRRPSAAAGARVAEAWRAFLEGYMEVAEAHLSQLLDGSIRRDIQVHLAAEILVRALGAFKSSSLYADDAPGDPVVREAVEAAAEHLRRAGGIPLSALVGDPPSSRRVPT